MAQINSMFGKHWRTDGKGCSIHHMWYLHISTVCIISSHIALVQAELFVALRRISDVFFVLFLRNDCQPVEVNWGLKLLDYCQRILRVYANHQSLHELLKPLPRCHCTHWTCICHIFTQISSQEIFLKLETLSVHSGEHSVPSHVINQSTNKIVAVKYCFLFSFTKCVFT